MNEQIKCTYIQIKLDSCHIEENMKNRSCKWCLAEQQGKNK